MTVLNFMEKWMVYLSLSYALITNLMVTKVLMIFIINNFIYEFIQGPQKVKYGKVGFSENVITAKNIIIATGSVPFVPKGIEVDGKHPFLLIPILPL